MNPIPPQNPFAKDPEAELARRLKHAKSLTREEFLQRLEEIQKKTRKKNNPD
ncbi:MAG: hypothetical protein WD431_09905 [Cyclobacteriaceae bacterium]